MSMDMDVIAFEQCIEDLETLFKKTDDRELFVDSFELFNKKMNTLFGDTDE